MCWIGDLAGKLDPRGEGTVVARPSALEGTDSGALCSSPLACIGDASGFALDDVELWLRNCLRWAPVGLFGFECCHRKFGGIRIRNFI